jgi:glycosyltransferase involved in cell wall biosynthesis
LAGQSVLASARRLVAVSQVEAEQYREAGIENERIRVVYNGLDLSEYAHLPSRGTFRSTLPGLAPETKVVLYLGRLHQRKGIDRLINAFAQVRVQEKAMLVIVGPDDGELTRLQALVTQLGLRDDVLFTGPRYERDKLAALVDADVLAYPGYSEIFGLVPFEALMCGTPVVVANDSGLGQLMGEAQAGYVVPYGDDNALANAIYDALADPAMAAQRVAAGQAFVRNHLQWPDITQELEQVYAEQIAAA